jgi:hypothetical protein
MTQDGQASSEIVDPQRLNRPAPVLAGRRLLRALLVFLLGTVISLGVGYFALQMWIAGFAKKRDALISELRAKGEPLSAEDMTAFNALSEGTNDLTDRYLAVVQRYSKKMPLLPGEEKLPIFGDASKSVPGPGEPWAEEEVAKSYLSNRPWLAEAIDLGEVDGEVSFPRDYSHGFQTPLGEVQGMATLVRDLGLQFGLQLRGEDRAEALGTLRAMFKVSQALEHEPAMVSQMVRSKLHRASMKSAADFLADGKATPSDLAAIRTLLTSDVQTCCARALRGERAIMLITFRSTKIVDKPNGAPGSVLDSAAGLVSGASWADSRPGDTAKMLELMTETVKIAEETNFPETLNRMRILEDRLRKMRDDEKKVSTWNRHFLTILMMPAFRPLAVTIAEESAEQLALKVALDVEEKMLALGPAGRTQEVETAAILEILPLDPLSGESMKYFVDGSEYRIYGAAPKAISGSSVEREFGVRIKRTVPN